MTLFMTGYKIKIEIFYIVRQTIFVLFLHKGGIINMFKIAVCDDEIEISSQIEAIILKYRKETYKELEVEVFTSGEELCGYLEQGHFFDLIYLDIEMKQLNGVQVGKIIRQKMDNYVTNIVYISGKDNYYKELFDVQPMHFLSKPVEAGKIIEDICLAMKLSDKLEKTFVYKKGYNMCKIQIKDIIYFESLDREIKIVTTKEDDRYYGKLEEVYPQVAKHCFIQIHKSYIINYAQVKKFKYDEVIMFNSDNLPISQSRRKEVREQQLKFAKERII